MYPRLTRDDTIKAQLLSKQPDQISARLHGNVALISMKDGWKSSTFCLKTTEVCKQKFDVNFLHWNKSENDTIKLPQWQANSNHWHCSWKALHRAQIWLELQSTSTDVRKDDQYRVRNGWKSPSRNHKEPLPETCCGLAMQFLWWNFLHPSSSQCFDHPPHSCQSWRCVVESARVTENVASEVLKQPTNREHQEPIRRSLPLIVIFSILFRHRVSQREVTSCPTSMAFYKWNYLTSVTPQLSHLPTEKCPRFSNEKKRLGCDGVWGPNPGIRWFSPIES